MYERYYELYMKNMVTLATLEKLVNANMLHQEDVESMVKDRMEKYGF